MHFWKKVIYLEGVNRKLFKIEKKKNMGWNVSFEPSVFFFIFRGEQRNEKIEGKNKVIFKRRRKKYFFFFWKWLVWCGVFSKL